MLKKILFYLFLLAIVFSLNCNEIKAQDLIPRLSGQILLQVEENGEAWYVSPKDNKRYFLGRPIDAFQVMKNLGQGISNIDIVKIDQKIDSEKVEDNIKIESEVTPIIKSFQDTDNDGLFDDEEEEYSCDMNNPDTDGDGYLDGDEVENGYDPLINEKSEKENSNNNETKEYSLLVEFNSKNGIIGLIDSAGRRIGKFFVFPNEEADVYEINEIPGAIIENNDNFTITIPELMFNGDYEIYISGLDNGEYNLSVSRLDYNNKELLGTHLGILSKHRIKDGKIKNANKENSELINPISRGSLTGKITDSFGNFMDSSEVIINYTTHDGSNYTDSDGMYHLYNILPGNYSIYPKRFGYTINKTTPITILSGENIEVDDLILVKTTRYYVDKDGDGYGGEYSVDSVEHPGDSFATKGNDCNDNDANINFDAEEICDGVDNNCDGRVDEGLENCDVSIEEKIESAPLYAQSITSALSNNPNTIIAFYAYYYDPLSSNDNRGYLTYLGDLGNDNIFTKSEQASDKNGILFLLVMSSGNSVEEQIITITVDGEELDIYLPIESPYIVTGERYYVSEDSSTYYQLYQGNGDFVSPEEAFIIDNIAGNANIVE